MFRIVAFAAVVAIATVACSQQTSGTATIAPGGVPDFRLTAYQGEGALGGPEVNFSQVLAKGKPVVLNFFAGQCPPCRAEMPDFQKVHEKFQDRVLILGLDIGPFVGLGSRDDGKKLLRELRITYPAATTFDSNVVRVYRVLGMPTTVFITPQGQLVKNHAGILVRSQMEQFVDELLRASTKS